MFGIFKRKQQQDNDNVDTTTVDKQKPKHQEPVESILRAIEERPRTFKVYLERGLEYTYVTVIDTATGLRHTQTKDKEGRMVTQNLPFPMSGHEKMAIISALVNSRKERRKRVDEYKRAKITRLYKNSQ